MHTPIGLIWYGLGMTDDVMKNVQRFFTEHEKAEATEFEARNRFYAAVRDAVENGPRGTQSEIVDLTGLTRERIRQIVKPYRRTITRFSDTGQAFITLLDSTDIHHTADYEIRVKQDGGKSEVLGVVLGQDLIDAREEQLAAYLAEDPRRTNIRLVDVSHLVDVSDYV